MKRKYLIILVVILISGCGSKNGNDVNPSAIPTESSVLTNVPSQVPDSSTGVVEGRFISKHTNTPLVEQTVYLGEFLPLQPGDDYLVTLEVEGSPHVKTDKEGYFSFEGIIPGDYPIIVWTPFRSLVVPDITGEHELTVSVVAGEVTSLGEVLVNWP